MSNQPAFEVRTIYVASSARDTSRYPNPSQFTLDLPFVLHHVAGIAIRNFKVRSAGEDLVLRIQDIEVIHAQDALTNRASAILYTDEAGFSVWRSVEQFSPLLQVQHRIQKLRIELRKLSDGSLYDSVNQDAASFVIEFHCQKNM